MTITKKTSPKSESRLEITLEFNKDETIENVKKKINSVEGIPISYQRLIFDGRMLKVTTLLYFDLILQDGHKTLEDYDITGDEATVFLVCASNHKYKY